MKYYAVIYHVVDDYVEKRTPFRGEHLRLLREAHDRGDVVMGGAFTDPPDSALLVFRVADASVIEAFVRQDPYVIAGLVKRWDIRPWNVVIGNEPDKA